MEHETERGGRITGERKMRKNNSRGGKRGRIRRQKEVEEKQRGERGGRKQNRERGGITGGRKRKEINKRQKKGRITGDRRGRITGVR